MHGQMRVQELYEYQRDAALAAILWNRSRQLQHVVGALRRRFSFVLSLLARPRPLIVPLCLRHLSLNYTNWFLVWLIHMIGDLEFRLNVEAKAFPLVQIAV